MSKKKRWIENNINRKMVPMCDTQEPSRSERMINVVVSNNEQPTTYSCQLWENTAKDDCYNSITIDNNDATRRFCTIFEDYQNDDTSWALLDEDNEWQELYQCLKDIPTASFLCEAVLE
jgi:hypothetical protein